MKEPLTHEYFEPYTGRRCVFDGQPVTLTLASVTANARFVVPGSAQVPFILRFHGPVGDILPAGHYRTTIQDGPVIQLHVLPIHTPGQDRQDYQAVFN